MVLGSIDKTTYQAGDDIRIDIDFSNVPELLEGTSNINIDIFRIDRERNNLAFGFGLDIESETGQLSITQKLPDNLTAGLYLVTGIRLIYGKEPLEVKNVQIKNINSLFFLCSSEKVFLQQEVDLKVREAERLRYDYINKEIVTDSVIDKGQKTNYKIIIFSVGCLLHSSQIMEGYTLYPLGHGYSYDHMLASVNNFTNKKYGFNLDKDDQIERAFSFSTPLFAIEFNNVIAINDEDASRHCCALAENIFTVLAYDRGQRPSSFATVMINQASGEIRQSFHFPGYKGNLLSAFNPSSTANTLERMLPKLEGSSWNDLIMRIYADAKSETNQYYSCLKYWSILEMLAKHHVQDNNIELTKPCGEPLLDYGDNVVMTNSALGKVYKYSFDKKIPPSISQNSNGEKVIFESTSDAMADPNNDETTVIVSLWELLSSLYEVRNATAHSGQFDVEQAKSGNRRKKKAAELWEMENSSFLSHIQSMLMVIVGLELNNALQ